MTNDSIELLFMNLSTTITILITATAIANDKKKLNVKLLQVKYWLFNIGILRRKK